MSYSSFDFDRLETAQKMKIERTIYFESEKADISKLVDLSLAELLRLRQESAAAEQTVFENLQEQAAAWEQQAGNTLLLDKAIEYARTPAVQHTSNEWQKSEYDRHIRSNRVYQMSYYIYENTRYDREMQKSIPYSWTLTWSVRTNSPNRNEQAKIAGQDRKVFSDKAAMEKYLNGRIKAYDHLFTEISPKIPKEYAEYFKVNGMLMPDYTIEGEEPPQQPQAAAIPETTEQQKEREHMSEQFSILIGNRSRFAAGDPSGYWLDMPATKEQLHEAMQSVGVTADNPQDFSIRGYSDDPEKHIALPYEMVCAADVDELNFLAARIEQLDPAEIGKLNAALQQKNGFENIGQIIDFTYNVDYFVHIPDVHTPRDLGDYYLNKSGMVNMPEEWKGGIDLEAFGKHAAEQEKGAFTEYGYIVESGDEWERQFEGRGVPEEYRIMSYPQPEQTVDFDAAAPTQTAQTVEQLRPVVPIILTSENPADKIKEITARMEQGIQAVFDSDRYKEFLTAMSKFHDYSLNNTILIAMQGGNLVKGYSQWQKEFERHVKKDEKGIKIFAPAPYKVKKQVDKIDPDTKKPMLDSEGKPIKEETEITVPAFKVVAVFDISQTEGKEFPELSVKPLLADVEQYEDFFAALEKASPVPIGFEEITNGANGYFSLTDKRIAIKEGVSELQAVKTAIHEIAHAKLHDVDLNAPPEEQNRVDRRSREVQAESVAYTVCQHFGLDTSDYSFGYVAGWSSGKEMTELKASLETIQNTANELINEIEGHFTELQQQRQTEQKQETKIELPLPDPTISVKDMRDYGYAWDGMLPLRQEAAEQLYTQEDMEIYRIYEDNTEGTVTDLENLREHAEKGGLFGVEKEAWEALREYKAMQQRLQEAEPTKEALLLHGKEDTFGIYQLTRSEETRDLQFEPYDRLQAVGHTVNRENYNLIYTAPLAPDMTLDRIFETFNIDHPADFKGHSLSVSDVVVLHQNGGNTAHYVDRTGFQQVPEFLQEQQKILVPDEHMTGEAIRTPRGTFYLTDMTAEQMKAAGYGVHHTSEDGQYLIMGNGTQAFAIANEQPQRDNPLKHVEDTVEQNDNRFDGIINNTPQTPTVAELEQKAMAGEPISLLDLANAIKTEKEAQPEKKPSIRAQLKAEKEKNAAKKMEKSKNHDLEV